jgi:hypothetical protein
MNKRISARSRIGGKEWVRGKAGRPPLFSDEEGEKLE